MGSPLKGSELKQIVMWIFCCLNDDLNWAVSFALWIATVLYLTGSLMFHGIWNRNRKKWSLMSSFHFLLIWNGHLIWEQRQDEWGLVQDLFLVCYLSLFALCQYCVSIVFYALVLLFHLLILFVYGRYAAITLLIKLKNTWSLRPCYNFVDVSRHYECIKKLCYQ